MSRCRSWVFRDWYGWPSTRVVCALDKGHQTRHLGWLPRGSGLGKSLIGWERR